MRNRSLRRWLTCAAATAALTMLPPPSGGGRLAAQAPAGLVTFDFQVVGPEGEPITDLKAADVTLRVGGKPREIRSLDLVRPGAAGGAPEAAGPAAPPFASNATAGDGSRTLLLVVDDESLVPGREQGVKTALSRLASSLTPRDRLGLLSVRRTGGANLSPTTDHAAVKAAVDAISGHSTGETAEAFRCRTMTNLQGLESVFAAATGDTPTTIVFFSASMQQPGEAMARIGSGSDLCRLTPEMFEQAGAAATASRSQFYVVHVIEGTTMSQNDAAAGIESLAGVTGTETLRMAGDGQAVVDRILRETSAYYVASFQPEPSDRNGTNQRVELRVAREGVRVRARRGMTLPRANAKSARVSPPDMLRQGTVHRDLPLRAAGYASRNPGDDKLRVIALFEPTDPSSKLTAASVGLIASDRLVAQWTAQKADLSRSPIMAAVTVPRGTYRMRVAAVDAQGRTGTVDYTLDANMAVAGPLQMSAMMLGVAQAGFQPKLQFAAGDTAAVAYMELYGVPKGANVTATLELAPSEDAPAIAQTPAQINPGGTDDARLLVGGFSIGGLQPGDVVMRAIVSVDGKVVGRALRTLRKAGAS